MDSGFHSRLASLPPPPLSDLPTALFLIVLSFLKLVFPLPPDMLALVPVSPVSLLKKTFSVPPLGCFRSIRFRLSSRRRRFSFFLTAFPSGLPNSTSLPPPHLLLFPPCELDQPFFQWLRPLPTPLFCFFYPFSSFCFSNSLTGNRWPLILRPLSCFFLILFFDRAFLRFPLCLVLYPSNVFLRL